MSSAAGPERPKCVQRSEPRIAVRFRPDPERTSSSAGTLRPLSARTKLPSGTTRGTSPGKIRAVRV